jgi:hypothetical protein
MDQRPRRRGGRVRPVLRLQVDEERDGAVHARPQHLGHGVDVGGAEVPSLDGRRHRGAEETEGLLAGGGVVFLQVGELSRGHEHESVLVRIGRPEAGVGEAELADGLHRIRRRRRLLQVLEEAIEILLAERLDEVVLVLEVVVDRRRGVLDRIRDAAHGDPVIAFAGEEVPRGGEDLAPHLLAFPFASFDHAHLEPSDS